MKFRILFVLFNFVIVAAFALIVFMPAMVLGWEYSRVFWITNWPVGIIFVVVLAGLNTYFGINWKLFTLLEKEDWPALIEHLERKVIKEGHPRRQRVRILINAYVVTGSSDKIRALERHFRDTNPEWVARFPLEFGIPYLLSNDAPSMEKFYGEMKDQPGCPEPLWVRWNYGFSLMLQQKYEEARAVLVSIADASTNPVQRLLTAYLLDTVSAGDDQAKQVVEQLRSGLLKRFTMEKFKAELERHRGTLQILVLSKLIDDASRWAFSTGEV